MPGTDGTIGIDEPGLIDLRLGTKTQVRSGNTVHLEGVVLEDPVSDRQARINASEQVEVHDADVLAAVQTIRDTLGDAVGDALDAILGDIRTAVQGTLSVDDAGGTLSIDDGGGSITVDGTVTTSLTGDEADLDSGAGADNHEVVAIGLPAAGGHVVGGTSGDPLRTDPTGTTTQPVSDAGGSLTVDGPLTDAELRATAVDVADGGGSLTVDGPLTDTELRATPVPVADGGGSLTVDGPLTDTELRASAVTVNLESDDADLDSGGGTDSHDVVAIGLPSAGGHVVGGTSTDPIRTDPTGTTTQPISDAGGSLTVDATDLDIRDLAAATDSVEARQATHDNLNLNANLQVGNADVAVGNPVPVSDGGGALTVDGTVGLSSDPTHAEDSAHQTGDTGTLILGVRSDTSVAFTDTDGDYSPIAVRSDGALLSTGAHPGVDGFPAQDSVWDVNDTPAANTQATAIQAAPGAGRRLVVTSVGFGLTVQASLVASSVTVIARVREGAAGTIRWAMRMAVPGDAGASDHVIAAPRILLPENTAVTIEFDAAGGSDTFESVTMGGYEVAI